MSPDFSAPRCSVVVTGVGVLSPLGIGLDSFWQGLLAGQSGVRRMQHFDPTGLPVEFGGEVPDFDPKQYIRPRKSLKVMSREIQFAFTAAEMALGNAGLQIGQFPPERLGVVFGSDMIYGELGEIQEAVSASLDRETKQFHINRWAAEGMSKIFPLWLLKYLPNMPACHVAIANDARASCNSIILGEVSALVALAEGVRIIERGLADMMIVGGVGHQINPTNIAFRANQELSKRAADPENACRPFDAARCGSVFGEGAGALVIENAEHARKRGAKALGRILSYAIRHEPNKQGVPLHGSAMRRVLESCLQQAGVEPAQLAHVHAHGIGQRDVDATEARMIAAVTGEVPVLAIKGATGNSSAGSGALELAASLKSLETGLIPPSRNCDTVAADCPIDVVSREPRPAAGRYALKLSHSNNGQAAAVLVERGE
jgi:3-oxoacyl-[acyl-carrier-protein] synthase II